MSSTGDTAPAAAETKTCNKVKTIVDVVVECTPPSYLTNYIRAHYGTPEYWERVMKAYEGWVQDFERFMRDHRSRDSIRLTPEYVKKDVCSCCGCDWEIYIDDDTKQTTCAGCGAVVSSESGPK